MSLNKLSVSAATAESPPCKKLGWTLQPPKQAHSLVICIRLQLLQQHEMNLSRTWSALMYQMMFFISDVPKVLCGRNWPLLLVLCWPFQLLRLHRLKQKCATSAPLKALDWKLLSDSASVAARWQEHFSTLLNRPTQSPPDALVSGAQASTPDSTTDTFPPTITEVYKAMNKIKAATRTLRQSRFTFRYRQ